MRDRIACALALSSTEEEFVESCGVLGLGVSVSRGKRNVGEYVYTHPGRPTWRVSGRTLGRDWSRWGVQRRLARDRQRGVAKPSGEVRERLLAAVGSLSTAEGAMAMQVLGTTRGIPVTAAAVLDMVEVCEAMDIRSAADFQEAIREPMPPDDRSRLRVAMRLARALGHLPAERDKADGKRLTAKERGVSPRRPTGTPERMNTADTAAQHEQTADMPRHDERHR